MIADDELYQLALECGRRLQAAGLRVAVAESCTGGWLAKTLTDVAGSSRWFDSGYTTYSNVAKTRTLAISAADLAQFGAVSREVALQMADGARTASGADLALSITGIAGPDGGTEEKPVGLVWFGVCAPTAATRAESCRFSGDREAVRRHSVAHGLKLLIGAVSGEQPAAAPSRGGRPGPSQQMPGPSR